MISQEQRSRISEHTDRVDEKASPEVISDGVHGNLNRGFEERRNLCAVHKKAWVPVHEQNECEPYPVNANLPALTPQLGSLSLTEPNLTC